MHARQLLIILASSLAEEYAGQVADGFEFLIAVGSMLGILLVIIGLLGVAFASKLHKKEFIFLLLIGVILMAVCGSSFGIRYFRLHV